MRGALWMVVVGLTLLLLTPALVWAQGEPLAAGQLEVRGSRLTLYSDGVTSDADQTINVAERARVRTCFGGPAGPCGSVVAGDPRVAGLVVRGELSGPELPRAVGLETVPGGTFELPGFQQEGDYLLRNIRLVEVASGRVVGSAEPALAVLHVRRIALTSATVTALSLADLAARGIALTAENFQAFDFAIGFAFGSETVTIGFPVLFTGNGTAAPLAPQQVEFDGLPPDVAHAVSRWVPPNIVPFKLELAAAEGLELGQEERTEVVVPLLGAVVLPGTVTYLNQFFDARLVVANGASAGSGADLARLAATLRLPDGAVLRQVASQPRVATGQAVPVEAAGGSRTLSPGEQGAATWTLEGTSTGSHAVRMEITGELLRPGREPLPLRSLAQATVEVVDARFSLAFSHPDVVRGGEAYSLFVTVANLSRATQNLITVDADVASLTGAHPADPGDDLRRTIDSLAPGEAETIELRLVAELTGKVVAATVETSGSAGVGSIVLRTGVGELGIPLSPATLILPRFSERLGPPWVTQDGFLTSQVRLLGLAYSLAVAPAGLAPTGLPRVVPADVERRAVDLAEAGQRTFLGEGLLESLEVLALDLLGNRQPLAEYDELRRASDKGLAGSAELSALLRAEQTRRGLDATALLDHFAATTSYTAPYLAALLVPGANPGLDIELRRQSAAGAGRLAGLATSSATERTLPFADLLTLHRGTSAGSVAQLALVGHVEADESFEVVVVNPGGSPADATVVLLVPDGAGVLRRVFLGSVSVAPGGSLAVLAGAATPDPGAGGFVPYDPVTGVSQPAAATPSSQTLSLPPLRLIGAVQDTPIDESGPDLLGNMVRPNRYGNGVSYLFNRPLALAAAERAASYRLRSTFDGLDTAGLPVSRLSEMSAVAAWRQPSERVVDVFYPSPLSALLDPSGDPLLLHEHLLDSAQLVDEQGQSLSGPVPDPAIESTPLHLGGLVDGRVLRGDGEPVAGALVELLRPRRIFTLDGVEIVLDRVGQRLTDAAGSYFFDYVESPHVYPEVLDRFLLRATVPAGPDPLLEPAQVAEVGSRIRLGGRLAHVDIALLGRGTVTGRLLWADDAAPVSGGTVTASSTLFDESVQVEVAGDGSFTLPGLPVGPITLTGIGPFGRTVYATVGLNQPGAQVDVVLELSRQAPRGQGTVGGRVWSAAVGTAMPVSGAEVAIYAGGALRERQSTDALGRFFFDRVPEGQVTLQAADWRISRTPSRRDLTLAAGETVEVDLTLAASEPREVTGSVFFVDPLSGGQQPVAGAVVFIEGPGVFTHTAADGSYRLQDVPVQGAFELPYRVKAIDYERGLQGDVGLAPLTAASPPVVTAQSIVLQRMQGGVDGVVLDPLGQPLAGAEVVLYPLATTTTAGDGSFSFDAVPVGTFTLTAHVGDGLELGREGYLATAPARVVFGGHRPFVSLRMAGSGILTVRTLSGAGVGVPAQLYYRPTWFSSAEQQIRVKGSAIESATNAAGDLSLVLPVGPVELVAYNPFHGRLDLTTEIDYQGQIKPVELRFEESASVVARLVDVDGVTPVPDLDVQLTASGLAPQTLTTDAFGEATFELVPQGRVRLTAAGVVGTVERVGRTDGLITEPGQSLVLTVRLKAQGTVRGRVVEDQGSGPVPLAFAQYYVLEQSYPFRRLPAAGSWYTTDEAGRYEVSQLAAGPIKVVARDPQQPTRQATTVGEISIDWQRVEMPDALLDTAVGRLLVTVRDGVTGAPLPAAQVRLSGADATVTDDTGLAIYDALVLGSYSAYAFYAPTGQSGRLDGLLLSQPGQELAVTVYLDQRGKIGGTLFDEPSLTLAVGGATVELSGTTTGGALQALATTGVGASNRGEFIFSGIPEGSFTVEAALLDSPRRARAEVDLTATAPIADLALVLEPAGDVYVRLYESLTDGLMPIDPGSGLFSLRLTQGAGPGLGLAYDVTQIAPLPASDLYLFPSVLLERRVTLDGRELSGEQRRRRLENIDLTTGGGLAGSGSAADPYQLVLGAKGVVRVSVRDFGGAPVAGADVTLRSANQSFPSATGSDGSVLFTAVPAGDLIATATSPTSGLGGLAQGTLTWDDQVVELTVVLAAAVSATGLIYQPVEDDRYLGDPPVLLPMAGAIVELTDSAGRRQTALTDAEGRYRFDALAIGIYSLAAQSTNGEQRASIGGSLVGPDGALNQLPGLILDAAPPRIVMLTPPPAMIGVSRTAVVEIVFSEPLATAVTPAASGQSTSPYFELRDGSGALATGSWSASLVAGQQVVRFAPSAPYPKQTAMSLRIIGGPGGVRDRIGRPLTESGDVGSNFTTSDALGPEVVATRPDLGRPVDPAASLAIDFNEALIADPEALDGDGIDDAGELSAQRDDGVWVSLPVSLTLTRGGFTLVVDPLGGFNLPGDSGRRRLVVSRLRDASGNPMAPYTREFRLYDDNPPVIVEVPYPAGAPSGELAHGATYSVVPVLGGLDEVTPENPAGDLDRVEYYLSDPTAGGAVAADFIATAHPFAFSFTAVYDGVAGAPDPFPVWLRAVDSSTNVSGVALLDLVVLPNAAPTIGAVTVAALAPVAGTFYAGSAIEAELSGIADPDAAAQLTVQAELWLQAGSEPLAVADARLLSRPATGWGDLPPQRFGFDLPASLAEGTALLVRATVTDPQGAVGGLDSAPFVVADDATEPAVAGLVARAADGSTPLVFVIGESLFIELIASDGETAVDGVEITFDRADIFPSPQPATLADGTADLYRTALLDVPPDLFTEPTAVTLTASVTDLGGNLAEQSLTFTVAPEVDPTAPVAEWLTPWQDAAWPADYTSLSGQGTALLARARVSDLNLDAGGNQVPGTIVLVEVRGPEADGAGGVRLASAWTEASLVAGSGALGEGVYQALVRIPDALPVGTALPFELRAVDSGGLSVVSALTMTAVASRKVYEGGSTAVTPGDEMLTPGADPAGPVFLLDGVTLSLFPADGGTRALPALYVYAGAEIETGGALVARPSVLTVPEITSYSSSILSHPLELAVSETFALGAGSRVDVSRRGLLGSTASEQVVLPGERAAGTAAGGSHGGAGGAGSPNGGWTADRTLTRAGSVYDSLRDPRLPGSGGAPRTTGVGGAGGGVFRLLADGEVRLAGDVLALGGDSSDGAGGGAGGTINITAGRFAGRGLLDASGGRGDLNYYVGGGGGGRIALRYRELAPEVDLTTALRADGGINDTGTVFPATHRGGAGTIYLEALDPLGGEASGIGTLWVLNPADLEPALTPLPALGGGVLLAVDPVAARLNLGDAALVRGDLTGDRVLLTAGDGSPLGSFTISGQELVADGAGSFQVELVVAASEAELRPIADLLAAGGTVRFAGRGRLDEIYVLGAARLVADDDLDLGAAGTTSTLNDRGRLTLAAGSRALLADEAPAVTLTTQPAAGDELPLGAAIELTWSATDPLGFGRVAETVRFDGVATGEPSVSRFAGEPLAIDSGASPRQVVVPHDSGASEVSVTVDAIDLGGHVTSTTVSWPVRANLLPSVGVALAAGASVPVRLGEAVDLTVHVEDGEGLAAVELLVAGPLDPASQLVPLTGTVADLGFTLTAPAAETPGMATVTARVTDLAGAVVDSAPLVIEVIGNAPPSGSLQLAPGTPTALLPGAIVALTVHAEDAEELAAVSLTVDGPAGPMTQSVALTGTAADVPFDVALDRTAVAGSQVTLTAQIDDAYGNPPFVTAPIVLDVLADGVAPVVTISGVAPWYAAGERLVATIDISDEVGAERMEISFDGAAETVLDPGPTHTFETTVDPALTAVRQTALTVIAYDFAGNASAPHSVPVELRPDQPPTAILSAVSDPGLLPGAFLEARLVASDDVGVDRVTFTLSGAASDVSTRLVGALAAAEVYRFRLPTDLIAGQTLLLSAQVVDSFGQSVSDQLSFSVLADITPPQLSVDLTPSAPGDLYTSGQVVTVTALASDDVVVDLLTLTVDGLTVSGPSPLAYEWIVPVVGVPTELFIFADAADRSGNLTQVSRSVTVEPEVDPTLPAVEFTCPSDGAMLPTGYDLMLGLRATDDLGITRLELFAGDETVPFHTALPASGAPTLFEPVIPAYTLSTTAGLYTFTARAWDTSDTFTDRVLIVEVVDTVDLDPAGGNDWPALVDAIAVLRGGTLELTEAHTLGGLILLDGAALTHPAFAPGADQAVDLTVTGSIYVGCDASIDVTGRGYPRGATYPGATLPGHLSGGSHLGYGGGTVNPRGSTYGSVYRPREAGGGGDGGSTASEPGGGVVRLVAGGTVVIDGGIRANGPAPRLSSSRGGAGGSIWLTAGAIAGDGIIAARGGNGGGGEGSGGGGAIALEYGALSGGVLTALRTQGGDRAPYGGAGTVYLHGPSSVHGDLIVGNAGLAGEATELPSLGSGIAQAGSAGSLLVSDRVVDIPAYFAGHWVEIAAPDGTVKGIGRIISVAGLTATFEPGSGIDIQPGDTWRGVYRFDAVTVTGNALLLSLDQVLAAGTPVPLRRPRLGVPASAPPASDLQPTASAPRSGALGPAPPPADVRRAGADEVSP